MRDTDAIHDESYQEEQCEGQRQKKKVNHQRTKGTAIETVLWNLERVDLMEIVEAELDTNQVGDFVRDISLNAHRTKTPLGKMKRSDHELVVSRPRGRHYSALLYRQMVPAFGLIISLE
ncbi:hypothetical protein ACO22_04465 [Paracoccidioides brasiliensis]|uniref:Uncharacterized protein n=1 Tax=Paracoccidioides brasiliensis TaxID=121759 RepID=A0A1D2JD25_PARBR|nr:hypothetical protein ACO22_04465 [Paracoccidioides brasiliensis]